jgi:hypothetical protein
MIYPDFKKIVYHFILCSILILGMGLNANSQIQFEEIVLGQGAAFEGVDYSSIAFSDVDGDGDEDVLITCQISAFSYISNL